MSRLMIKICGLSDPRAVAAALDGGASHLGFIFFAKSPRNIAPQHAGELARAARGRAITVAVTVDATNSELDAIVAAMQPRMLQLHGQETPQRVAEIKARHNLPMMKAIAVRGGEDLAKAQPYRGIADLLLFDAKPQKDAELPGGNGVAFDWSLLAGFDPHSPYMLSGGVNLANLDEAIALCRPAGIDVSSGVETAPGVKDEKLITQFLETARRIERKRPTK